MKSGFIHLIGMLVLFGSFGCANGKKLEEKASEAVQQAYFSTTEDEGSSGLNFYLQVDSSKLPEVKPDSVFFHGKRAQLIPHPEKKDLYVASFEFQKEKNKNPDFVMSSDPREEYGNEPPLINRDFPFNLKSDEAMISFTRKGETFYHKIDGIENKDDVILKNPENIRH